MFYWMLYSETSRETLGKGEVDNVLLKFYLVAISLQRVELPSHKIGLNHPLTYRNLHRRVGWIHILPDTRIQEFRLISNAGYPVSSRIFK